MTRTRLRIRGVSVRTIGWLALLCLIVHSSGTPGAPPPPTAGPAPAAATPAERAKRVSELARKVLNDPFDNKAIGELDRLRREQRRARLVALDRLSKGMAVYAKHGAGAAAMAMRDVLASPSVLALANANFSRSIQDILKGLSAPATSRPARTGRCSKCADMIEVDCPICRGLGAIGCSRCGGRGQGRSTGSPYSSVRDCVSCGATGMVACKKCGGTAVVPCPTCAKKTPGLTGAVDPIEADAAKRLSVMARHLRQGGVDLYSPDALKASPKPAP